MGKMWGKDKTSKCGNSLNIRMIQEESEPAIVPPERLFSNSFKKDLDKIWALKEDIPDPKKPTYRKH